MISPLRIQEKFLEVNGKKIHYLEAGPLTTLSAKKVTPVVLVHGLFGSSDGLVRLIPILASKFKVLVPDLPGFGCRKTSEELDSEHTIDAYADFMHLFAEKLGFEKVSVMGHSMGGTIALQWAVRWPDQVVKLAVFEPGLGSDGVSLIAQLVSRVAYRVKGVRKLARWLVAQGAQREEYVKRLPEKDKGEVEKEIHAASLRAAAESARDLLWGTDLSRYHQIKIPVLLISGSGGSSVSTPAVTKKLTRVIPEVQVEEIPEGAHAIIREDQGAIKFAKLLSDFFSS